MSDHDTAPQHPLRPDPEAPMPPPVSPYATQVAERPAYDASYGQAYNQPYGQSGAPGRPRLRDIVLGLRGVVAVAVASLIIGGLGGWALGANTDGNDRGGFGPSQFQGGNMPNRQFPRQHGPFTGQAPDNTRPNQPNR